MLEQLVTLEYLESGGNQKHHRCIGHQTMTRTRVCNNPKPNNGGKYCTGDPKEDIKRTCQIEGKKNLHLL